MYTFVRLYQFLQNCFKHGVEFFQKFVGHLWEVKGPFQGSVDFHFLQKSYSINDKYVFFWTPGIGGWSYKFTLKRMYFCVRVCLFVFFSETIMGLFLY